MQPLTNLKRYLAVLLILIVPAVMLAAFFRNYSPEGGPGHAHSQSSHTAMGPGVESDKPSDCPKCGMALKRSGASAIPNDHKH